MKKILFIKATVISLLLTSFTNAQNVETGGNARRAITIIVVSTRPGAPATTPPVEESFRVPIRNVADDNGIALDERFEVTCGNARATVTAQGKIVNPNRNLRPVAELPEFSYDPVKRELRVFKNKVSKRGNQNVRITNQDNQQVVDMSLD